MSYFKAHLNFEFVRYREGLQEGEGIAVSPTVKSGVVYLHKGSKVVAKCTRYLRKNEIYSFHLNKEF